VNSAAPRPVPLGGFWALLLGGLALVAALIDAHPIVDPSGCSNAGAAGNASAFADPAWDLRLPLLVVGWFALVGIEQTLPTAWRHRTGPVVAARAAVALFAVIATSWFRSSSSAADPSEPEQLGGVDRKRKRRVRLQHLAVGRDRVLDVRGPIEPVEAQRDRAVVGQVRLGQQVPRDAG
jgi:hypothetical protein